MGEGDRGSFIFSVLFRSQTKFTVFFRGALVFRFTLQSVSEVVLPFVRYTGLHLSEGLDAIPAYENTSAISSLVGEVVNGSGACRSCSKNQVF